MKKEIKEKSIVIIDPKSFFLQVADALRKKGRKSNSSFLESSKCIDPSKSKKKLNVEELQMKCRTCEGSKTIRDNKSRNEKYTFRKNEYHTCNGTGETPIYFTVDELIKEGNVEIEIHCESIDCDYELSRGKFKDLNFRVSMDGGHLSFIGEDGEGGTTSECPSCKESTLIIVY